MPSGVSGTIGRIMQAPSSSAWRPWQRAAAWLLALVAVAAAFTAYLDPSLMVTLGNAVWSCF